MLKKHVFGSFNMNIFEKHKIFFGDNFLGKNKHLLKLNKPITLGRSGGGGGACKVCCFIAYMKNAITIIYINE